MLDATLAKRVRHILILAVALHLYATCRFVYSWPMDEAYLYSVETGGASPVYSFAKVNKNPPFNILYIDVQPWQSEGQQATVVPFKWLTVIVLAFCLFVLFGTQLVEFISVTFCTMEGPSGEAVGISFFSVPKIGCYCPVVEREGEIFICADTTQAMEEFQPSVANALNVSLLVPEVHRKHILSTVKWYGLGKTRRENNVLAGARNSAHIQETTPQAAGGILGKMSSDSTAAAAKYLLREAKIHPTHGTTPHELNVTHGVHCNPGIALHGAPSFASLIDVNEDTLIIDAKNDDLMSNSKAISASATRRHGKRRIRKRSESAIELAPIKMRGVSPIS